jgi:hypothetical protein
MKTVLRRGRLLLLAMIALAAIAFTPLTGCVASAGAYAGDGEYYYDAPGYVVYDGWGPNYHVGPPREGHHDDHHDDHHDSHPAHPPAYRPAPSSRAVPSIPTQSHSAPRPH